MIDCACRLNGTLQQAGRGVQIFVQVNGGGTRFALPDLRVGEQITDEFTRPLRATHDELQHSVGFRAQLASVSRAQDSGEA